MDDNLSKVYEEIQSLEGVPVTRTNVMLLADIYLKIEDIAAKLQEAPKATIGGTQPASDGDLTGTGDTTAEDGLIGGQFEGQ